VVFFHAILPTGQYYNIRVEARDKDATANTFHTDDFQIELAHTTCGCRSDERTGTPTGFSVSQYLGKVCSFMEQVVYLATFACLLGVFSME
jgi:hypothetical protein